MTPYAIAVALFAAFVVGGILAKAVPLWLVAMTSLAIGAAVFVFVDRYPRLPREPVIPPPRRSSPEEAGSCSSSNLDAIPAPPDPAAR
jgi:hypothetical protein